MYKTIARIACIVVSLLTLVLTEHSPAQNVPASQSAVTPDDISAQFASPPAEARPWVYWFWNNGNVTKEGITADLEAMRRVGIGGVLIMDVVQMPGPPEGKVAFMGDEWRSCFKFAVSEAARLGLAVNMTNGPGWCGSSGPWITPELSMQTLVVSVTKVPGGAHFDATLDRPRIPNAKKDAYNSVVAPTDFYRDVAVLAVPAGKVPATNTPVAPRPVGRPSKADEPIPANAPAVAREAVIDLSAKMDASGRLSWDAPAGDWIVYRIGHCSTGSSTRPKVIGGNGLECDKLSTAGMDAQFAGMMQKLIDDVGADAGKTLVTTHIDSWEVGNQNWTEKLREEFQTRRGYDLLKFLPVLTNKLVIDSPEITSRFRWDFNKTLAELIADNYVGRLHDLAVRHGLKLSIEGYNLPLGDESTYTARADEPMCEFWTGGAARHETKYTPHEMASVSHTNGKIITGAESFTSGNTEQWLLHPALIKAEGDYAMAQGINRFVFHRYAFQPWLDRAPGATMGPWGLHYERTNTWWEMSAAWHQYLARCHYLLRRGLFVADLLYLRPDTAPQGAYDNNPPVPDGYSYDQCSAETVLKKLAVRDGRLVLPDGMSYRLLVLPPSQAMPSITPELAKKLLELAQAGATLIGPRPEKSPSLTNYPQCDAEVAGVTAKLWGDCDGARVTEHTVGAGLVLWGPTLTDALARLQTPPDFTSDVPLHWIHRREGGTDFYFVANPAPKPATALCTFRAPGRQPQWWDAQTGEIFPIPAYAQHGDLTTLRLHFDPSGSGFVVFPPAPANIAQDPVISITRDGQPLPLGDDSLDLIHSVAWTAGHYELKSQSGRSKTFDALPLPAPIEVGGSWSVTFPPKGGAPASILMDKLSSFSDHANPGVKYFSGTATYDKTLTVPSIGKGQRLYLDLGEVDIMARVKLNGQDLGILWKPPFRVEITSAVRPGDNTLQIEVVNLWINRMVGDQLVPKAKRIAWSDWEPFTPKTPLQKSGLIGPVQIVEGDGIAELRPD